MGLGRGPNNDDEGFFVSADFKCFRKGGTTRVVVEAGTSETKTETWVAETKVI